MVVGAQDLPQPIDDPLADPLVAPVESTLFGDPTKESPSLERDPELAQLVSQEAAFQQATPTPKPQAKPSFPEPNKKEKEAPPPTGPVFGELKMDSKSIGGNNPFMDADLSRWRRDPRGAMRQAQAERKLLLLWFANSKLDKINPKAARMGVELFEHTDFLKLAQDNIVRVRVDYGEDDTASHPYAKLLQSAFGVMGFPHIIVYSPDKQKLWERRGYKPNQFTVYLPEITELVGNHKLREQSRMSRLLADGYRNWSNFRKQSLFAKPVELSRETKLVTLRLTNGQQFPYPVIYLSDDDRGWLAEKLTEHETKFGIAGH